MARLFQTGFEINTTTDGVEFDTWSAASGSLDTSTKRSGSRSLHINGTGTNIVRHEYSADTTGDGRTFYFSWWVYVTAYPSTNNEAICGFINPGITVRVSIRINTDGTLNCTNSTGTSSAMSLNAWHKIVLVYTPDTKATACYLDGTNWATGATGVVCNCGVVEMYVANTSLNIYYDDVIVNDSTGSYENGIPGDDKLVLLTVDSAGDSNTFLKTDASAGDSNNYNLVDESPPDDVTTFVESKTTNQEDFYNVTSPLSGSNTIKCVTVHTRQRGAAASAVSSLKAEIKKAASGTISQSAAVVPNSTTWRTCANAVPRNPLITLYKDPDNSDWTTSTIGSMQLGVLCSSGNTNYVQVSAIWAYVAYIPNPYVELIAAIAASSTTPDIAATIKANILAAITAASTTPNIATTIKRNVLTSIIAGSTTPDVVSTLARKILAAISAASSTPDVASTSKRNILSAIVAASTTPDNATATTVRKILASINAGSVTGNIVANFVMLLAASISASSVTPDIASTFLRRILAGITAISTTPDIAATFKRNILASITAASSTQDVLATLKRNLLAAIQASSVTPDNVTPTVAELFQLVAAITAASTTGDIATTSKRNLLASAIANSTTGDVLANIIRHVLSSITSTSTTGDIVIGLFVLSQILNMKLGITSTTEEKDIFSVTSKKSILSERTEV